MLRERERGREEERESGGGGRISVRLLRREIDKKRKRMCVSVNKPEVDRQIDR